VFWLGERGGGEDVAGHSRLLMKTCFVAGPQSVHYIGHIPVEMLVD
jgi:hypothetical protein